MAAEARNKSDPGIEKLCGYTLRVDAWLNDDSAVGCVDIEFGSAPGLVTILNVAQVLPEPTDTTLQQLYPEVPTNAIINLSSISFSKRRLEMQCDLYYTDDEGDHAETLIIAFTFTDKVDFRDLPDEFDDTPQGDAAVTRIIKNMDGAPALRYTIKEVDGVYGRK